MLFLKTIFVTIFLSNFSFHLLFPQKTMFDSEDVLTPNFVFSSRMISAMFSFAQAQIGLSGSKNVCIRTSFLWISAKFLLRGNWGTALMRETSVNPQEYSYESFLIFPSADVNSKKISSETVLFRGFQKKHNAVSVLNNHWTALFV